MPNLQALRKKNLRALIKQWDGPTNLAKKLGYSGPSYLSQMIGEHKPITEKTARFVETTLDPPAGWLDNDNHDSGRADTANVARVLLAVGAAIENTGAKVSPGRLADIATFVYEHLCRNGVVDDEGGFLFAFLFTFL